MKIRVFEAFSGIGAQAMSLKRLQAKHPDMLDFEFVGTSEIEPSAIKAYNAVHGDVKCYGDITKIDWSQVPDFDLFTMSSPCQDFSVAGRQAGAEEGSGTRSSLLWECRKAIIAKKPKYILFENVSAVVSKKFIRGFNKWQAELESYGYTNFAKVLNSKDYCVPQNRERLFMISILDCAKSYHFPEPFKLEKRIKDILEPYGTVDESFYFSPEQLLRIIAHCDRKVDEGCGFKTQFHTEDEISSCVTTRYGQRETDPCIKERTDKIIKLGNYTPRGTHAGTLVSVDGIAPTVMGQHGTVTGVVEPALTPRLSIYADNGQAGRVYDVEGISPCLDTCSGGNRMPKILEPCILTPQRTEEAKELRRKGIEVFGHRELVPREDGVSNTITTVQKDNLLAEPAIIQRPHGWNPGGLFEGICPTITTSSWEANNLLKEPVDRQSRIRSKVMPNGNIRFYQDDESKSGISEMQIIHPDNECPTITVAHVPKILEPIAARMVGRNPEKPSDRGKCATLKQRFEFGTNIANCITTVQKDSMVAEPQPLSFDNLPDKTVLKDEDGRGYLWQGGSLWRVRKLTPIEVFRLQDVSDEDAKKIIAVCSKTACYQLAGNSITCAVLYHIFRKLWIDTENESAQKSLFDF